MGENGGFDLKAEPEDSRSQLMDTNGLSQIDLTWPFFRSPLPFLCFSFSSALEALSFPRLLFL